MNPESSLKNNAIVKRDEYGSINQDRIDAALLAFGKAVLGFLKPEMQHFLSPEDRLAITKVNDGAKLIADLFYRLSLSRRALIKPAFNTLAKKTADAIPADDFLFGSSFGEEIKKAATMEKSCRDMVNTSLAISKKVQQPIRPPTQPVLSRLEDSRAPEMEIVGDEEDRGFEQQSPVIGSPQISVEEALEKEQVNVAGRLSDFLSNWKKITSDPVILQDVAVYKLLFKYHPLQNVELCVCLSKTEELNCQITKLCIKGAIEHVLDCEGQFLSPFFVIKKSSRGWRFILNLNCCSTFQNGRLENGYPSPFS